MVMTLILISSKPVEYSQKCRFMEEFLLCIFTEITLLHGVISSKFAAFLQNIFSEERYGGLEVP